MATPSKAATQTLKIRPPSKSKQPMKITISTSNMGTPTKKTSRKLIARARSPGKGRKTGVIRMSTVTIPKRIPSGLRFVVPPQARSVQGQLRDHVSKFHGPAKRTSSTLMEKVTVKKMTTVRDAATRARPRKTRKAIPKRTKAVRKTRKARKPRKKTRAAAATTVRLITVRRRRRRSPKKKK